MGVDVPFPALGYFEIADYPVCFEQSGRCGGWAKLKVSPDGRTLFIAGAHNLVITPIPAENTLIASAAPPQVLRKHSGAPKFATKAWRVDTTKH